MEEDPNIVEGRNIYTEALRRGSKRLAYRNVEQEDLEDREGMEGLRVKRQREAGEMGHGWEHITPERSPDPGRSKEFQEEDLGRKNKKPQRFANLLTWIRTFS